MTQEQFIGQVISMIENNIRLLRMGIESTDNLDASHGAWVYGEAILARTRRTRWNTLCGNS